MDWSDLPSELLITIAGNLTEVTDHLRFRSVCSHWRSSSLSASLPLPPQLPWLALPSSSSASFYSLSEDRIYSNPPPVIPNNSNIFGSASGWFLSLTGRNRRITASLVNPFTGALIGLPSLDRTALSCVGADTLVWDRSDNVVVAACSTRPGVFHCQLGGTAWAWAVIEPQRNCMASSITFHEGRFYILQADTCDTVVLDGETLEQITSIAAPDLDSSVEAQLFVSSGELLLLVKSTWMYLFPDSDSQFYKVRRANLDDDLEWAEIDDMGNRALFVDNLHCFSVEVGDNSMLRRNCVYSAQSRNSGGRRNLSRMYSISIFDLGNSSCERLEGALNSFPAISLQGAASPPSWVMPALN